MLIFTDGSAQGNPGPTGSATVIKKQDLKSVPIKRVKAISSGGTSCEGELDTIYMGTEYARENLSSSNSNLYIYIDSQAAIKATIWQSRTSYHKNTI